MKAPDKIYLLDYQSFGMSYSWYENPQNIDGIMVKPENVEYIRKDLLLEWANYVKQGLIVEMGKYGVPNEQRIFAFQEFIDKLNSL